MMVATGLFLHLLHPTSKRDKVSSVVTTNSELAGSERLPPDCSPVLLQLPGRQTAGNECKTTAGTNALASGGVPVREVQFTINEQRHWNAASMF